MSDNDAATTATTYGMRDGFDYDSFAFSDDFPIPLAYVVAYGMAHFRGPDGHLWFAPDKGLGDRNIEWGCPQNVAEFDQRQEDGDDAYHTEPEYRQTIAELCRAVDALIAADNRYHRWCTTPRERARPATSCGTPSWPTGRPVPPDSPSA